MHRTEGDPDDSDETTPRYSPLVTGWMLPFFLLLSTTLWLTLGGFSITAHETLSIYFSSLIQISLYHVLLMFLLPLLRKYISARACAWLWMIPNYLYITHRNYMELEKPMFVIRAPGTLVWTLSAVWLVGFFAVLIWNIAAHLRFRAQVLRDSTEITDPQILDLWNREIKLARIKKPKFKLVTSPNTATPLSIGLFRRTTRVVLPDRSYSMSDLQLIFRHEIVHIAREDAWSKFFLVFCTAMCWFNPLMWFAMRKSSDDLELSCDETVLLDADDATRRQYANLILDTAGDDRGFTTCLSASAKALQYRLKNIVKPQNRRSGAFIVAIAFFVLCMSCGYVGLAYDLNTGAELIYESKGPDVYTLKEISRMNDSHTTIYECTDPEAFYEYMAGLTMSRITGEYTFNDYERQYTISYDTPEGTLLILLSDYQISLTARTVEGTERASYYLPDGVDWEYLDTVIFAYPSLKVSLADAGSRYDKRIYASLDTLKRTGAGETTLVYQSEYANESPSGIFGSAYQPYQAALTFSHGLVSEYTVLVETWDHSSSYTISQGELEEPFVIPLPEYPAHYTIYATVSGPNGETYIAEFRFDVGEVS